MTKYRIVTNGSKFRVQYTDSWFGGWQFCWTASNGTTFEFDDASEAKKFQDRCINSDRQDVWKEYKSAWSPGAGGL